MKRRPESQRGDVTTSRSFQQDVFQQYAAPASGDHGSSGRSELCRLAALTADGLVAVVDATLAGDRAAARDLLRASRRRRSAYAAAVSEARLSLTQRSPGAPLTGAAFGGMRQAICRAQLVAEVGTVGDLVDALARGIVRHGVVSGRPTIAAADAEALKTVGGRRLRLLAEGVADHLRDPDYRRDGTELRRIHDLLGDGRWGPSGRACAAIAEAVLHASRYAARVA